MLKTVRFKNLTTVPNDDWQFAAGLNVIVGENGLGKSHILKAIYSLLKVQSNKAGDLSKTSLEKAYADKLISVTRTRGHTRTRGQVLTSRFQSCDK